VAARDAALARALARHPRWILGGSLVGWGKQWLAAFDLVVFRWLPPALRLQRLQQRELKRYGNVITSDPVRAEQHRAFLTWTAGYDDNWPWLKVWSKIRICCGSILFFSNFPFDG
jgi:hypothetical protein